MFAHLVALASEHGTRLGVLCGASSLLVWEGGPRLTDLVSMPPEVHPEADLGIHRNETRDDGLGAVEAASGRRG